MKNAAATERDATRHGTMCRTRWLDDGGGDEAKVVSLDSIWSARLGGPSPQAPRLPRRPVSTSERQRTRRNYPRPSVSSHVDSLFPTLQ